MKSRRNALFGGLLLSILHPVACQEKGSQRLLQQTALPTASPTFVGVVLPPAFTTTAPATRAPLPTTLAPLPLPTTLAPLPIPLPTAFPVLVTTETLTPMPSPFPTGTPTFAVLITPQPFFNQYPPTQPYYTPTYYYPTTPRPYYYYPTTPYVSPVQQAEEAAEQQQQRKAALITVAVMFGVALGVLIWGRNEGQDAIENFESPQVAVKHFHEDLFRNKYLSFTIPKFTVRFPGCTKPLYEKPEPTRHALFFATRIKSYWRPWSAYAQFVFGWLSLFTTIIGIFAPSNTVNSVIGCGALFISELIVHVWYGYFRYPNVASCCQLQDRDDDFFDLIKEYCTILYHGDGEHHDDKRIAYIGFLPTLVYHGAALFFIALIGTAVTVLSVVGCWADDGNRRRRSHGVDTSEAIQGWFAISVWIGSLLGSAVYPLGFLLATNPAIKIIAPILHHMAQEYYEAKLFEKDLKHFGCSMALKFFGEVFLPVGDGFSEMVEDLEEAYKDAKEELDRKDEEELNDVTQSGTESTGEEDAREAAPGSEERGDGDAADQSGESAPDGDAADQSAPDDAVAPDPPSGEDEAEIDVAPEVDESDHDSHGVAVEFQNDSNDSDIDVDCDDDDKK